MVAPQQQRHALGGGHGGLDRPLQQELELVDALRVLEPREGEHDPLALPPHRHAGVAHEQIDRDLAPERRVVERLVERLEGQRQPLREPQRVVDVFLQGRHVVMLARFRRSALGPVSRRLQSRHPAERCQARHCSVMSKIGWALVMVGIGAPLAFAGWAVARRGADAPEDDRSVRVSRRTIASTVKATGVVKPRVGAERQGRLARLGRRRSASTSASATRCGAGSSSPSSTRASSPPAAIRRRPRSPPPRATRAFARSDLAAARALGTRWPPAGRRPRRSPSAATPSPSSSGARRRQPRLRADPARLLADHGPDRRRRRLGRDAGGGDRGGEPRRARRS